MTTRALGLDSMPVSELIKIPGHRYLVNVATFPDTDVWLTRKQAVALIPSQSTTLD